MRDGVPDPAGGRLEARFSQRAPIPLDVAISCAPGELVALVGPSGSGKTSVLRAIAGLLSPADGAVTVGGATWFASADRINLPPQRRSVGLVFQDYALFPHLTALETVALAVAAASEAEKRERARALLGRVNLEGFEERLPSALSGGQRQRVALARALAREPKVLLMDEPFSAVDQATRERLKRELVTLRRLLSIPILLVTHDIEEAVTLADRIAVLYRGKLLMTGTPDEVRLRPTSGPVARLMGQTNLFEGTVLEPATEAVRGWLSWRGARLEVARTGGFAAGARVAWLAPTDHVLLHRRGRPVGSELVNPVRGTVVSMVTLGERTAVTLRVSDAPDALLNLNVSTRTVRSGDLVPDAETVVSLLPDGIHLMGPEAVETHSPTRRT
jgi:molybdate transport system ATP-binding protein